MEPELSSPGVVTAVAVATAVVTLLALAVGSRRPRRGRGAVRVAHTERLRALPSYRRAVRRRRLGLVLTAALSVAVLGLAGWIGARPMVLQTRASELDNRDIVLCLDVSGSMNEENLAILRSFRALASELRGERIGLVIFDSTPLVLFPLTDDYDLVRARLEAVEASMEEAETSNRPAEIASAVRSLDLGQSLVGDGLMGCTQQFAGDAALDAIRAAAPQDPAAHDSGLDGGIDGAASGAGSAAVPRSRVVLLATDNEQGNRRGAQIFSVAEAGEESAALGAVVVVLDANEHPGSAESDELAELAVATGGAHYAAGAGQEAVAEITAIVEGLDSTVVRGEPITSRFDVPGRALDALLPLVLVLLVVWRVVRP